MLPFFLWLTVKVGRARREVATSTAKTLRGPHRGHRGDPVGLGDPALEVVRAPAPRDRPLPGRERAPDRPADAPDDDRPVVLRDRGHVLLDHAGARLPRRGVGDQPGPDGAHDHRGDDRGVHDAAVAAVLPDRLDAAGLDRGPLVDGAVRPDLRVPGPRPRDRGRARRGRDPSRPRCSVGSSCDDVWFRYETPAGERAGPVSPERPRARQRGAEGVDAGGRLPHDRAGPARGPRRAVGSRQDHDDLPRASPVRRAARRGEDRRGRRAQPQARVARRPDRRRHAGDLPVPHDDPRNLLYGRPDATRGGARRGRARREHLRPDRGAPGGLRHRSSASAGTSSRAARSSGSRSPA